MKHIISPVDRLAEELSKLPGIGIKTARRIAFYLLNEPSQVAKNLASVILEARSAIKYCSICGNLTEKDPCSVCSDPARDKGVICVVEYPKDFIAIEKTGQFSGVYHVLHGTLSPMEGISVDDLNIKNLIKRLKQGKVKEVILAMSSTVEGDTTAMYLSRLLKDFKVKVTRLAYGIPVGVDLEYTDEYTLSKALMGRHEVDE